MAAGPRNAGALSFRALRRHDFRQHRAPPLRAAADGDGPASLLPPIYTGGAKREIAATLREGGVAYGLIDVPAAGAVAPANAVLFGAPVHWPTGLVDCARAEGADLLLLTACCERNGRRRVEADRVAAVDVQTIAAELERRIRAQPGAWHFWHLRPAFAAR